LYFEIIQALRKANFCIFEILSVCALDTIWRDAFVFVCYVTPLQWKLLLFICSNTTPPSKEGKRI